MNIETKYSIGDRVYFYTCMGYNALIIQGIVRDIKISTASFSCEYLIADCKCAASDRPYAWDTVWQNEEKVHPYNDTVEVRKRSLELYLAYLKDYIKENKRDIKKDTERMEELKRRMEDEEKKLTKLQEELSKRKDEMRRLK